MHSSNDNKISANLDFNDASDGADFSSIVLDSSLLEKSEKATEQDMSASQILHVRVRSWRTGL